MAAPTCAAAAPPLPLPPPEAALTPAQALWTSTQPPAWLLRRYEEISNEVAGLARDLLRAAPAPVAKRPCAARGVGSSQEKGRSILSEAAVLSVVRQLDTAEPPSLPLLERSGIAAPLSALADALASLPAPMPLAAALLDSILSDLRGICAGVVEKLEASTGLSWPALRDGGAHPPRRRPVPLLRSGGAAAAGPPAVESPAPPEPPRRTAPKRVAAIKAGGSGFRRWDQVQDREEEDEEEEEQEGEEEQEEEQEEEEGLGWASDGMEGGGARPGAGFASDFAAQVLPAAAAGGKVFYCQEPNCGFVASTFQSLGGHKRSHNVKRTGTSGWH